MTPEDLAIIEAQAETEVLEQAHSATPYAVAIVALRDAVAGYATGVVWSPTCSGCTGLGARADTADRARGLAEAALSATVAEVQRLNEINLGIDTQLQAARLSLADCEAQGLSLQGENASHLDTIATLEAQILALQGTP